MEKRRFGDIRKNILLSLAGQRNTINDISKKTKTNWKTVENHLNYLRGRGLVNEAFSSEYVRIFELTPEGQEFIKYMQDEYDEKILKMIRNNMSTAA